MCVLRVIDGILNIEQKKMVSKPNGACDIKMHSEWWISCESTVRSPFYNANNTYENPKYAKMLMFDVMYIAECVRDFRSTVLFIWSNPSKLPFWLRAIEFHHVNKTNAHNISTSIISQIMQQYLLNVKNLIAIIATEWNDFFLAARRRGPIIDNVWGIFISTTYVPRTSFDCRCGGML